MKRRHTILVALCTMLGSAAHAAAAPQRIVSLKPTITDVVVALGTGERLVGVTRYCDVPASGRRPEIVGDYTQPFIERIIALDPDVVLGSKENSSRKSVEQLSRMGIRVELFPFSTVAETLSSIRGIGSLLGADQLGKELALMMEKDLAALKQRWGATPTMRIVVVWGVRPLIVAGPQTYMDELLDFIGAENAVQGTKISYPRLGLEELIALDPDAIVDLSMGSEASPPPDPLPEGEREKSAPSPWPSPQRGEGKDHRPWDGVTVLRAVREKRIFSLDAGLFRAGPRLPAALAKLAELIHK